MKILIALPVLDEEKVLRATTEKIRAFADASLPGHETEIVIADNGSTDATPRIAEELSRTLRGVRVLRLERRGKGLAIRSAWSSADAGAYVFMDADLATDLGALPALVARLAQGADLSVGSRFHPDSTVERSLLRKALSWGYRVLLRAVFGTRVTDVPCGFKVVSRHVVREIMPLVKDDGWFFDTELLMRSERAGMCIAEVPVTWRELKPAGRRSKVRVLGLAVDYFRKAIGLRRKLGSAPLPHSPYAGVAALMRSLTPNEKKIVIAAAVVAMALSAVGPLATLIIGSRYGLVWNGRQFLSPGDLTIYLSYIAQARDGGVLMENFVTTEPLVPVFNAFWSAVGLFSKVTGLAPLAAYVVSRIALIPVLAATAYLFIAYVLPSVRHRVTAFLLFLFGSGIGPYVASFLHPALPSAATYEWPIDFWVGESNTFLTMLYSPHFVASLALILAAAGLMLLALDTGKARHAVAAGLVGLMLFQFHPFHAPTLYAVFFAWVVGRTLADGLRIDNWRAYATFVGCSAPAVAYHWWLTHLTANARFMLDNNLTITPGLFHVVVGLGMTVPLAIIGTMAVPGAFRPAHRRAFALWAIVHGLIIYAPFTFQRRLIEGIAFPLAVLAAPAVVAAFDAVARRRGWETVVTAYAPLVAAVLFLPATVGAVVRSADVAQVDGLSISFMTRDERDAYAWLSANAPRDAVILAAMETGNLVAGWGERRTYVGHWANTIDLDRKLGEASGFFGNWTADERRAFLTREGITYVMHGPRERALGGDITAVPGLRESFSKGEFVIYGTDPEK